MILCLMQTKSVLDFIILGKNELITRLEVICCLRMNDHDMITFNAANRVHIPASHMHAGALKEIIFQKIKVMN